MPSGTGGLSSRPTSPWRRPDELRLELFTTLPSSVTLQSDEFGWERWYGRVFAGWNLGNQAGLPPVEEACGDGYATPVYEEDEVWLRVGHLERYLLTLDDPAPLPQVDPVGSGFELFEAGDALSQGLADVTQALMGEEEIVSDAVQERLDVEAWELDRLLILDTIELVPSMRGHGVGAWASARALQVLARDASTLIATKAAPLHKEDFQTTPSTADLAPSEQAAWDSAQRRIASHWCRTLDLVELAESPGILVGRGGFQGPGRLQSLHWPRGS